MSSYGQWTVRLRCQYSSVRAGIFRQTASPAGDRAQTLFPKELLQVWRHRRVLRMADKGRPVLPARGHFLLRTRWYGKRKHFGKRPKPMRVCGVVYNPARILVAYA